jgi:hydrogenase 3 maturation protease
VNVLLGIGNDLHGDDGIGVYVSKKLCHSEWVTITAATSPENYGNKIARVNPEKIVIVDAAEMGLKPGSIRLIPKEKIGVAAFSTHSAPLSLFISFLENLTKTKIYLVGIQPKTMYGQMSDELKNAADEFLHLLSQDKINELQSL